MSLQLNNKVYDVLKWVCMILIPAIAVFYAALDKAFGWGCTETVSTVCAALAAFIGSLIGVSTASYNAEQKDIIG